MTNWWDYLWNGQPQDGLPYTPTMRGDNKSFYPFFTPMQQLLDPVKDPFIAKDKGQPAWDFFGGSSGDPQNWPWRLNAEVGRDGSAVGGWLKDHTPSWLTDWIPNYADVQADPSKTAPLSMGGAEIPKDYGPGPSFPPDATGAIPLDSVTPPASDPLQDFLKRVLAGGGSGGGPGASMPKFDLPAYPDIPVPQAPTPRQYDRTKIDELLAKAQPKAPESDDTDYGWATLLGAAQGFDPHGTAGEILGRLVGPAAAGLQGERNYQRQEKRSYDKEMADYYQGLAGTEANIQGQELQRSDLSDATTYNNAVAQRAAELEKFGVAREDAYKQAELEIQFQNLALNARQVEQGDTRNQLTAAGLLGRYGAGSGGGKFGLFRMIHDSVSKGMPLPGVDMAQLSQNAMAAVEAQHPNLQVTDPTSWRMFYNQAMSNALLQLAEQDPNLAAGWQQMYSNNTGSALDIIGALGGGL